MTFRTQKIQKIKRKSVENGKKSTTKECDNQKLIIKDQFHKPFIQSVVTKATKKAANSKKMQLK